MGSVFRKQLGVRGNTPSKMRRKPAGSDDEKEEVCVCHLQTVDHCGICDQPYGTKSMYCQLHPKICGEEESTCDRCTERGLELISGTGWPDQIIDHKANKTYSESELPLRPYIKNFE